jgi:hypothetical protein
MNPSSITIREAILCLVLALNVSADTVCLPAAIGGTPENTLVASLISLTLSCHSRRLWRTAGSGGKPTSRLLSITGSDPLQTISRTASAAECNLIFARISVRQYQGMRWLNWDPHVSDEIYDRAIHRLLDGSEIPFLQINSNGRNTLVGPGPGSCTQFTRSTRPEFEWFLFDQPSWHHVVGSPSRGAAFW